MRTLREWLHRLAGTLRPGRRDEDLAEELRLHAQLAAAHGRRIDGPAQAIEAVRDQRGVPWLDDLGRDTRHAFRSLRRTPAFSVVALVTLALGIGATITMFSVLDQVVLRPLPYPGVDRLVRLQSPVPGIGAGAVWNLSTAEYFFFNEAQTIDSLGIYVSLSSTIGAGSGSVDAGAERVLSAFVSAEVFELLGARPVLGRLFAGGDHRYEPTAGPPAVVISHDVWQSRFGGARDVIGRTIVLDQRPVAVIGVLPPRVDLPEPAFLAGRQTAVWLPLSLDPNAPAINQHTFRAIARLRSGATVDSAQRELDALTSRLPVLFPSAYSPEFMSGSGFSTAVVPLREDVLGSTGRLLWVLAGAISLVLAIALANVTNLFLVRTEHRRRELGTRLALGASKRRLARYMLVESLLLSLIAAAVAVGVTHLTLRVLVITAPANIPRLGGVRVDQTTVLVAAIAAVLAAACVASFTTARLGWRENGPLLRMFADVSSRPRLTRVALVVGQVALSLLLVSAAGLMAKSVLRLLAVDPGFATGNIVVADLVLPRVRYVTEQQIAGYHRQLAAALEADPYIERVSAATITPLDGTDGCSAVFVEARSRFDANQSLCLDVSRAAPGYFDVLGIRVRGRAPDWTDLQAGVAVVSESAARRLWPGQDPIGRGLRVNGSNPPYYRVVGVAEDVLRHGFDRPPAETVYFPIAAVEGAPVFAPARAARLVIRTRVRDLQSFVSRVRSIAATIDPNVPMANVQTMDDLVAQSTARRSLAASVLVLAAFLALVLSAVGLYGVISYGVASRARELAVRLSVGAQPWGIRAMVLRETLTIVMPGLVLGTAAALVSTRALEGLLFGIEPRDVATLSSVGAALLLAGLAAGTVPAWRASRLDPNAVLRVE